MYLEICKNKLDNLEKKYFNKQNDIDNYYHEVIDVLTEYQDQTDASDIFDYISEIVSSEDMACRMANIKPNSLYYWGDYDNIMIVNYNLLTELLHKTIDDMKKNKENSIEL